MSAPLGFEDVRYLRLDPGSQSAVLARFLGRQFGLVTVADSVQPVLIVGDATTTPQAGDQQVETYSAAGRINRLNVLGNVFEMRAPGDSTLGGIFRDLARGFLQLLDANLSNTVFQGLLARQTQGFQSDFAVIVEDIFISPFPGSAGAAFSYAARFDDIPPTPDMIWADTDIFPLTPTNQDVSLSLPGTSRVGIFIGSRSAAARAPNAPSLPYSVNAAGTSFDAQGKWILFSELGAGQAVYRPFIDQTPFLLPPATTLTIGSMAVNDVFGVPTMSTVGLCANASWREVRVREAA